MGKFLIGLIVGLVIGAGGMMLVGGGMVGGAMGLGAATGLSAGICSMVEAAEQSGLLDASQIEQVLKTAADNMKSVSEEGLRQAPDGAGTLAECKEFMTKLRSAG